MMMRAGVALAAGFAAAMLAGEAKAQSLPSGCSLSVSAPSPEQVPTGNTSSITQDWSIGLSCSSTTSAVSGKLYVCLRDQGYQPSTGGQLRGPGNVAWNYARGFEGQATDALGFGPPRLVAVVGPSTSPLSESSFLSRTQLAAQPDVGATMGPYTIASTIEAYAQVIPNGFAAPTSCAGFTPLAAASYLYRADLVGACSSVTASDMDFGTALPVGGQSQTLQATATVSAICTAGLPVQVTASLGNHFVGQQRRMKRSGGNDYVGYEIFRDAGRTLVLGNDPSQSLNFVGTGIQTNVTLFGQATLAPGTEPGLYTDIVAVTLSY